MDRVSSHVLREAGQEVQSSPIGCRGIERMLGTTFGVFRELWRLFEAVRLKPGEKDRGAAPSVPCGPGAEVMLLQPSSTPGDEDMRSSGSTRECGDY